MPTSDLDRLDRFADKVLSLTSHIEDCGPDDEVWGMDTTCGTLRELRTRIIQIVGEDLAFIVDHLNSLKAGPLGDG